jgi:hypothetical protein
METEKSGSSNRIFQRGIARNIIAVFYVFAFFGTIAAGFLVGLHNGFDIKDYKEMLLAISAVLSGPLGFIIGYCFPAAKE